jgi:uncharacterized RDD family membrane protein YckC
MQRSEEGATMDGQSDIQRFEELERQADAELGAIGEMTSAIAAFYAEEVIGNGDPALWVAELAREAERAYLVRGLAVPAHVILAARALQPLLPQEAPSLAPEPVQTVMPASGHVAEMEGAVFTAPEGFVNVHPDNLILFDADRPRRQVPVPVVPEPPAIVSNGQLALKLDLDSSDSTLEVESLRLPARPIQMSFSHFFEQKVIPLRDCVSAEHRARPLRPERPPSSAELELAGQSMLDLLPSAPLKQRRLSSAAMIDGACIMHRVVAAALDASLVLIASGIFWAAVCLLGGRTVVERVGPLYLFAVLSLLETLYGLTWCWANGDSPGKQWMRLRLLSFDGLAPNRWQRFLRFASWCLSALTVIGICWPLLDENGLGWQDHISKTMLTVFKADDRDRHRRAPEKT